MPSRCCSNLLVLRDSWLAFRAFRCQLPKNTQFPFSHEMKHMPSPPSASTEIPSLCCQETRGIDISVGTPAAVRLGVLQGGRGTFFWLTKSLICPNFQQISSHRRWVPESTEGGPDRWTCKAAGKPHDRTGTGNCPASEHKTALPLSHAFAQFRDGISKATPLLLHVVEYPALCSL